MKHRPYLLLLFVLFILSCHKKDVVPTAQPTKPVTPPTPPVYHQDGEVKRLLYNDPNGVNIVVLGDAFIEADLDTGGYYDQQVKSITDYMFTVAPFKQNKQHFNIYVVYAQSRKRGAAIGYNAANTNTKFNAYFDTQVTRLLSIGNADTANAYIEKAVPLEQAHLVLVIVNDPTYGGSGGYFTTASTDPNARLIMIHEIGHSFGGLTDEYVDDQVAAETVRSFAAAYPNTDTTNDPLKIKWARFLTQPIYNGIVGAFEGGYYRAVGVYRPEEGSIMSGYNYSNYNGPSREAIVRNMDTIMHIPFNFADFVRADSASAQPIYVGGLDTGVLVDMRPIRNDFIGGKSRMQLMKERKGKRK